MSGLDSLYELLQGGNVTLTDTNGHGGISAEEITAARDASKDQKLAQLDTDGNGDLSRAERKEVKQVRKVSMLAEYDTNGDGKLSPGERNAGKEAKRAAIESQLDVNQDGVASDLKSAGHEEMKEPRSGKKHGHKRGKNTIENI